MIFLIIIFFKYWPYLGILAQDTAVGWFVMAREVRKGNMLVFLDSIFEIISGEIARI